jgi:nucleotide-binding universal stress UspA family protein
MLKVLVPSDGSSNSLYAIRHVIDEFNKGQGLEIHLLNVQPPFSKLITEYSSKSARMEFHQEQADAALLKRAGCWMPRESRTPFTQKLAKVDCIVDAARRLHCDLIVMSTARKSSLVRLIENSVTNQVLENKCPRRGYSWGGCVEARAHWHSRPAPAPASLLCGWPRTDGLHRGTVPGTFP